METENNNLNEKNKTIKTNNNTKTINTNSKINNATHIPKINNTNQNPNTKKHSFFDTHAHLDMINENELNQVISDATNNNIKQIISCSTDYNSNKKNLLLSKQFNEVKNAIGLYPLNIIELNEKEIKKYFDFFKKNVSKSIAIGEVGLDYKYSKNGEEQEKQKIVFEQFIKLGKKYDKPLIIHSRYAQRDVLKILEQNNAERVILHGFIESKKMINRAINNNYFISMGMIVLSDINIQKNVSMIPITQLLFETDSPIRFNQEKVFPKQINEIVHKISEIKKISLNEISFHQKNNFEKLFSKKL